MVWGLGCVLYFCCLPHVFRDGLLKERDNQDIYYSMFPSVFLLVPPFELLWKIIRFFRWLYLKYKRGPYTTLDRNHDKEMS